MVRAVFPPCCNEDNGDLLHKVLFMHYHTQCPRPSAGHYWPMPLPGTSGHSKASLGQYFMGSLLLSPGSWYIQSFVCALQESVSQILCKFWWLYGGVNGTLLQEGYAIPRSAALRAPASAAGDCWPTPLQEALKHSKAVLAQSVGFSGVHKVSFVPSEHLWRAWGLILNMISLLLPSCWGFSFALGHGVSFFGGIHIPLSTVVHQGVVILEFLQEKMSARPSTPPSADDTTLTEESKEELKSLWWMTNLDSILKKQRHYFANKGPF